MDKEYKINKWIAINIIITVLPLLLIGTVLWLFNPLLSAVNYYFFLPLIITLGILLYMLMTVGLSVIIYKLHKPLKEGLFSVYSEEMESWRAAQLVLTMINALNFFHIPSIAFRGLYKRLFKTDTGKILIINPGVEHSLVSLGDHVVIGQDSKISGHAIEGDNIYIKKVKIGSNVTIGANSLIFPGVEIGDGTIIGAYSLVPKNSKLEANSLYLGIPVKKIRLLSK